MFCHLFEAVHIFLEGGSECGPGCLVLPAFVLMGPPFAYAFSGIQVALNQDIPIAAPKGEEATEALCSTIRGKLPERQLARRTGKRP